MPQEKDALRKMTERQFRPLQIAANVGGIVLFTAASLVGCGWQLSSQAWVMVGCGALLIAVPQIVLHTGRIRRDAMRRREETLTALTDLCFRFLDVPESADPRVTLHVVNFNYKRPVLEAVARSCYSDRTVPKSTMEITQGVAGRCYRNKTVIVQEDVPDFLATMMDLGFMEEDAKQFDMHRKNYACIPVMDTVNNVLAVLSLDASTPNVYDAARVELAEKFTPFFARLLLIETTVEE